MTLRSLAHAPQVPHIFSRGAESQRLSA
ncbi:protein of unknown function [Candidatus Methylomirabilis oxygeniifera]|uniref:Uncharacterized protein n=1 Tax=Methylomirabilis oxygeniifera TaxID=671143 RepID=D5MHW2_METO1|nr:protein of unknown function [Candidatus Methylomirabilis oxyfera]